MFFSCRTPALKHGHFLAFLLKETAEVIHMPPCGNIVHCERDYAALLALGASCCPCPCRTKEQAGRMDNDDFQGLMYSQVFVGGNYTFTHDVRGQWWSIGV